jgi:hypothetical protein
MAYYYDHPDEMRAVESQQQAVPDGFSAVRGPADLDSNEEPEPEA